MCILYIVDDDDLMLVEWYATRSNHTKLAVIYFNQEALIIQSAATN